MSRNCSICVRPDRALIDQALVQGTEAYRTIAKRFEASAPAVLRHKKEHLPASLALAKNATEVVSGGTLLDQVRALLTDAKRIQSDASAAQDLRTALSAIREQARIFELLARLLGELEQPSTVVNVIAASPEWLALRFALTRALAPHPEAAAAVARALSAAGHP